VTSAPDLPHATLKEFLFHLAQRAQSASSLGPSNVRWVCQASCKTPFRNASVWV
jgi:hypothetical protein